MRLGSSNIDGTLHAKFFPSSRKAVCQSPSRDQDHKKGASCPRVCGFPEPTFRECVTELPRGKTNIERANWHALGDAATIVGIQQFYLLYLLHGLK